MRIKSFVNTLAVFAMAVFLAVPLAFAQDDAADDSVDTLTKIRANGELKVGVSVFEPWVMRDKDANLVGYEIEVARKLAEDLGVELKLQPVGFAGILGDLNAGRFDVIITGMYATPERALLVNFTEPMKYSTVELISNSDQEKGDDLDDYDRSDATLGFVAGTVYGGVASSKFPKAKIQAFATEDELFAALSAGRVTAAIASTPAPQIWKARNSKLKIALKEPLARFGESMAVRRGDLEFLNYLNTWVRYYRDSDWAKSEYQRWFVDMDWMKNDQ